jgi:pimeloyl-ACP methyl ester carboxylesterase
VRDAQVSVGARTLAYVDIGDAADQCVIYFHGAPMSRLHLAYLEDHFLEQHIRVIAPDRPGYGKSSPQPGRVLTDWASDVAQLANEVGIDRFIVAGHSSGGPYAVSTAALLRSRVEAGIVFGGVTDMVGPEAWIGYPKSEAAAMRQPTEAAAIAWCTEQFGADGAGFSANSDFHWPQPDTALFTNRRDGKMIMIAAAEAFRQGIVAYAQDAFIQGRPWQFDPSAIEAPFLIVHGDQDTLIPISHSRHTCELIPNAQLRVLSGHGHMTTLSELPALVSALSKSVL